MNTTFTRRFKQPLVVGLVIAALSGVAGHAATTPVAQTKPKPDPAGELRNQDSAFSLLIEVYRQFQNNLIQSDFERRLRASGGITDAGARNRAMDLAGQEKELRVRKLCVQLASFGFAYDHARHGDETREGITVPHEVDTDAAAEELKKFVVITPRVNSITGANQTIPADVVLRDKRPSL